MISWLALTALTSVSLAQEGGFDAHGLSVTTFDADTRAPLSFTRPGRFDALQGSASVLLDYAETPLLVRKSGTPTVLLDNLLTMNVSGGLAVHDRVRLHMAAPVYMHVSGPAEDVRAAGVGDLHAGGLVAIIRPGSDEGTGLGVQADLVVPTGNHTIYLGQNGLGAGLTLNATHGWGRLTASGMGGVAIGANAIPVSRSSSFRGSDSLIAATGLSWLATPRTGFGVEGRLNAPLDSETRGIMGVPVQVMATVRHRAANGLHMAFGAGTAVLPGAGAAPLRLVLGGGFGAPDKVPEMAIATEMPDPPSPVLEPEAVTTAPRLLVSPADAEVWVPHPVCEWVPVSESEAWLAMLPADAQVSVSAPGFLAQTLTLDGDLEVALQPAPPQGGVVVIARPRDKVLIGAEVVQPAEDGVATATVPEGTHTVVVIGGGRRYEDEAALVSGYAVWVRAADPEPLTAYFTAGASTLSGDMRQAVSDMGVNAGDWTFEVQGSYSPEGSVQANETLAQRRAESVSALLQASGVESSHIRVLPAAPPTADDPPNLLRKVTLTPVSE